MTKSKIAVNEGGVEAVASSDRAERWDKWLANYAVLQPVKYEAQLANHEFDEIPASFK